MKARPFNAKKIIRLLEIPSKDRRPLKNKLIREATIQELVEALRISRLAITRRILCDVLAVRGSKSAIPALINCLDDLDWEVRSDAAEALAKIGSYEVGKTLLEHLQEETLPAYVFALGSIGYLDAIPALTEALQNGSSTIRGAAAWSLGYMRVSEARDSLIKALQNEKDDWVSNHLRNALKLIENNL